VAKASLGAAKWGQRCPTAGPPMLPRMGSKMPRCCAAREFPMHNGLVATVLLWLCWAGWGPLNVGYIEYFGNC
jgi:hypothetical protein